MYISTCVCVCVCVCDGVFHTELRLYIIKVTLIENFALNVLKVK